MTEAETPAVRRSSKGRSPSYPGIPLATAIERARVIWGHEKRNPAPVRVMMKHWGYSNPTGGLAAVTFAALKKFGLVEDEGSGVDRPAKLTELAFQVLHNPEPVEAIKRAALTPPIHRELWETYGPDLPSEATLKYQLMQRGFTDSGSTDLIREYAETVAFAQLADQAASKDTPGGSDADTVSEPERKPPPPRERDGEHRGRGGVNGTVMTIPVPIIGGSAVTIEGEFPVSEAAWNQFLAVLNAMKPGLVAGPTDEQDE